MVERSDGLKHICISRRIMPSECVQFGSVHLHLFAVKMWVNLSHFNFFKNNNNKITRKYMAWQGKGGEVDVHSGSFFSFFLFFTMVNSWEFSVFCFMRIFNFFLFSYNSFHSADHLQSQNSWLKVSVQVPNPHHHHWQGLPFVQQSFRHVSSL